MSPNRFSAPYHFIDANDNPPSSCGVDYERDCGASGCVVGAISNYVRHVLLSCVVVFCVVLVLVGEMAVS